MRDNEIEVACDGLLGRAWKPIAASSWNRYQLHGKGALLASIRMLTGESSEMDYITPNARTPLPDWLEAAIREYDPDTSLVLVFVEDEVFRGATRPTGLDLLEEHTGVLRGRTYFRVVERTPTPSECAMALAN